MYWKFSYITLYDKLNVTSVWKDYKCTFFGEKKYKLYVFPFFQFFFFGGGWGVGVGDLLAIRYLKEITSTLLNSQLQPIR